jgi:hypothetical protein
MTLTSTAAPTRSLKLGYDPTQDRLSLVLTDGTEPSIDLRLTRRFTQILLNGLAGIVERSSKIASQAPAEMRDDVILMEHQRALNPSGTPRNATSWLPAMTRSKALPARLVSGVKVSVKPSRFELTIEADNEAVVTLPLDRLQLHRLLEQFKQHAEFADWKINIEAAWMEPEQTELVIN